MKIRAMALLKDDGRGSDILKDYSGGCIALMPGKAHEVEPGIFELPDNYRKFLAWSQQKGHASFEEV